MESDYRFETKKYEKINFYHEMKTFLCDDLVLSTNLVLLNASHECRHFLLSERIIKASLPDDLSHRWIQEL